MTVTILVVIGAFICAIATALGKCPAWVPVILICVAVALMVLPK